MRLIKLIVFAVILSIVVYYAPAVLTTFTITSPAVEYEAANVTRLGPMVESDENVTVQSTPLLQVYREESGNAEYMQVYVYNLTLSLAVTLAVFIVVRRIRRAYS